MSGGARVVNKLATVIDIVVPFLFDQDKGHGQWPVTHCVLHTACYTLPLNGFNEFGGGRRARC